MLRMQSPQHAERTRHFCRSCTTNRRVVTVQHAADKSEILLKEREHKTEDINDGGRRNRAVKTVEHAAVPGEQKAVILDSVRTLYHRCNKVAALSNERDKQSHDCKRYVVDVNAEEAVAYDSVNNRAEAGADDSADSALDRLFRRDLRDKLMPTEKSAAEVCKAVTDPRENKRKEEDKGSVICDIAQTDK